MDAQFFPKVQRRHKPKESASTSKRAEIRSHRAAQERQRSSSFARSSED